MTITFEKFEIGLFCPSCGAEFVVLGKRLSQSRDVPCPACAEIVRVDVWSWHAQFMRFKKMLDGL